MADLTRKLAAAVYKLVGADRTTGNENSFSYVESRNGEIKAQDIVGESAAYGAITLTTTVVAIRVSVTNLANRKSIIIYNNSNRTIYWGTSNALTTANGMIMAPQSYLTLSVSDNTTIYARTNNGNADIRVVEFS